MGLVDQRSLDFIFAASMAATIVGTAVSLLVSRHSSVNTAALVTGTEQARG
jgi:hypothetical protein